MSERVMELKSLRPFSFRGQGKDLRRIGRYKDAKKQRAPTNTSIHRGILITAAKMQKQLV